MTPYLVSESRIIAAEPQRLFDVVADPAMHPVIDGSGTVRSSRGASDRLRLGARFGMNMKMGAPYRITSRVVEFEEPMLIAWRHPAGHIWRYLFEPVDGGTKVTEQFDARSTPARLLLVAMGSAGRNQQGILATLQRLEQVVVG